MYSDVFLVKGRSGSKKKRFGAPYFGISDSEDTNSTSSLQAGSRASMNIDDEDSIGGFAYNIEATESLALVTNFFLHHAFNVEDADKVRMWLMKFKELDLRLLQ
jgi:hypothetical protein